VLGLLVSTEPYIPFIRVAGWCHTCKVFLLSRYLQVPEYLQPSTLLFKTLPLTSCSIFEDFIYINNGTVTATMTHCSCTYGCVCTHTAVLVVRPYRHALVQVHTAVVRVNLVSMLRCTRVCTPMVGQPGPRPGANLETL